MNPSANPSAKGSGNPLPDVTGADLRDAGVAAVLDGDFAAHRMHRRQVDTVIGRLIASGDQFTVDDVRAQLPSEVTDRMAPNLIGAAICEQRRAGHIRQEGWRTSARRSRHCGPVRVWASVRAEDYSVVPLRRVA